MDNDAMIDAVMKLAHRDDPFALDQDEWSIVAKAMAFEVRRLRQYAWNLRQELHLHEDCPSCPADAGEPHRPFCVDYPRNWTVECPRTPGPTGDFLDDLARLVRDHGGVR